MNKFLAKTIGQWKIWSLIAAVLLVAGIVVGAVFGFNAATTADSVNTLTVRMESYNSTAAVARIEEITNAKLGEKYLKEKYTIDVEISDGKVHEYVYTFDSKTSVKTLNEVKENVKTAFEAEKTNAESALYNAFVYVTVNEAEAVATLASGFVWRGFLAGAVLAVLVFAYSAIRHKFHLGLLTGGATLLGGGLTIALIALLRIPSTASVSYAIAFSMLYAAAVAMLFASHVKDGFDAPENEGKDVKEKTLGCVPAPLTGLFAATLLVALVLVGAIAVTPVSWLAVAAILGLVASTFVTLMLLPSVYVPVRTALNKRAEKRARYDYKKGAKKAAKAEKSETAEN